jgi:two-component system chemotaxis sensor kinase CheA
MRGDESLIESYIYEEQQLLESLENLLLDGEHGRKLSVDQINEVFRIMHTIKGAAAMMEFDEIARLSHALEDVFAFIREYGIADMQWPSIFNLMFDSISYFNGEISKLQSGNPPGGNASSLIKRANETLMALKSCQKTAVSSADERDDKATSSAEMKNEAESLRYIVKVFFEENSQMENLRAFGLVEALKKLHCVVTSYPADLNDKSSAKIIVNDGLLLYVETNESPDNIKKVIERTLYVKSYSILPIEESYKEKPAYIRNETDRTGEKDKQTTDTISSKKVIEGTALTDGSSIEGIAKQSFISVNVNKLDTLLNIVGEIVTAQSIVVNSVDLKSQQNEKFEASTEHMNSLIKELQDIVMSIRMVPISTIFYKMRRLVRDMSRKVGKEIELEIIGEGTEVDKNVIDALSDPILHIIRNSVDHGIEDIATRLAAGKPAKGKITLEAKTTGSDIIVTILDDGRGLQRDGILKKAIEKGIISEIDDDIPDKDVFAMIFMPGFSTNENVSEYSGRGVGLDVVKKNISQVGGSITVESKDGFGTKTIIRIPQTLTIIDGMKFAVGRMNFIVPTTSVRTIVKPEPKDVFVDADGNEIFMIQGAFYPLLRMKKYFGLSEGTDDISQSMVMHLSSEEKDICIFFDEIDGQCQVVVKTLPHYLSQCSTNLGGIGGCAILGDGSISFILDVNSI